MSKKLYPETDIQNIANAIRALNGSTDTYTVSEMSSAITLPENGYYLKESTEANPLSITDGEELNAQSCEVSFEPIQDLNGQTNPYPAGGGKNKLDKADSSALANSTWLNVECNLPAGTYTFSFKSSTTSGQCTFNVFDSNGDRIYQAPNSIQLVSTVIHTFTISSAGARVSSYINVASNISEVMIEVGSTKTDFAPYSNICPIRGWDSVDVVVAGKNLFDFSSYKNSISATRCTYTVGDNSVTITATGRDSYIINSVYKIENKGQMTVSWTANNNNDGRVYVFCDGEPFAYANNGETKHLTFTPPAGTEYITIRFGVLDSGNSITYSNIQVELGSTATYYNPYIAPTTHTATFSDTVYEGSHEFVSGKATLYKKFVSIDGSNEWVEYPENSGKFYCDSVIGINEASQVTSGTEYISNMYIFSGDGATPSANITVDKRFYGQRLWGRFWVYDSDYANDLAGFKTMLNTTPLQICYPLATPTEITLTPETIELLKGNNVLWSDSNGNVKLKYFSKSLS